MRLYDLPYCGVSLIPSPQSSNPAEHSCHVRAEFVCIRDWVGSWVVGA